MNTRLLVLAVLLGFSTPFFTSCSSAPKKETKPAATAATKGKAATAQPADDLDEYQVATIPDPLEPVNRVTFWVNHQLYTFVFRPVSKTYEFIVPKVARTGVSNAFSNVEFPIRFVNDLLQGKPTRAGQELGRFVVNSTAGVGGLGRPADHIPALANVVPGETGDTFAKWGIGHGFYFVIPLLGPSSARDTVGLAGDYALNPLTWVSIVFGGYSWIVAIGATDTVSLMPNKFVQYDAATKNSLDRYLAARTAYAQYRNKGMGGTVEVVPAPSPTPQPSPKKKG